MEHRGYRRGGEARVGGEGVAERCGSTSRGGGAGHSTTTTAAAAAAAASGAE